MMENKEWREYSLAEVCNTVTYGYTESASNEKIGPKFLRITDIANGKLEWDKVPYCKITPENFEKYKLETGDIVIARTGATTGANYTFKEKDPKDVVYASYLIKYSINKSIAYPFFIGYILKSSYWTEYVSAIAGGSAQPGANAKELGSFTFSLPPLPEQKAIAAILSSLDDKIDLLQEQNKTLEAMAETLFRQWFIEEAKEDWEEVRLEEISTHYKKSVQPNKYPDTLYSHFSIPSFDNGKKPIIELGQEIQSNKYSIPKYSILFSKLNPHKDKRIWLLLDNVPDNAICSTEFQIIKPKKDNLLYFIYGWLSFSNNYNEIASGVGGTSSSHQRIDPKSIFDFRCLNIDDATITKYNTLVKPLFEKQNTNAQQIQTLTELRDTLLPKLMSGEVRVKDYNNIKTFSKVVINNSAIETPPLETATKTTEIEIDTLEFA